MLRVKTDHVFYSTSIREPSPVGIRLEIKGFWLETYRVIVASLSKTLFPLHSTGSTQEDKLSQHD